MVHHVILASAAAILFLASPSTSTSSSAASAAVAPLRLLVTKGCTFPAFFAAAAAPFLTHWPSGKHTGIPGMIHVHGRKGLTHMFLHQ